jgi:hypothetical protein
LVHTARTQGLLPGLPSQEASGRDRSAPQSVGQIRFGTGFFEGLQWFIAGWSSPVARQAHNLKVTGSNPVPATRMKNPSNLNGLLGFFRIGTFLFICQRRITYLSFFLRSASIIGP